MSLRGYRKYIHVSSETHRIIRPIVPIDKKQIVTEYHLGLSRLAMNANVHADIMLST